MKYIIFLFLLFVSMSTSIAQEKYLELFNSAKNKTISIKEGKRIRVKTSDGNKFSGRLYIIDATHISIQSQSIDISDIVKVKFNPLTLNIAVNGFIYFTTITALVASIWASAILNNITPLIITTSFAILLDYLASKSPNFIPSYKINRGWSYSIH